MKVIVRQLFVLYYEGNIQIKIVIHLQHHKTLIWIADLYAILWNALEISKNTPLISSVGLLTKLVCNSWIMARSWAIHESPGRKLDCESVKKFVTDKVVKQRIIDYPSKYFAKNRE